MCITCMYTHYTSITYCITTQHPHDTTTHNTTYNACVTTCICIDTNTCSMRSTHTHTTHNTTSHHSSHHLVFLLSLRFPLSLWFCLIVLHSRFTPGLSHHGSVSSCVWRYLHPFFIWICLFCSLIPFFR